MPQGKADDNQKLKIKMLKQRFLEGGIESLSQEESLELLLSFSEKRADTNVLAKSLLERFSFAAKVFDAPFLTLLKTPGISQNSAVLLKLVPPLLKMKAMPDDNRTMLDFEYAKEYFSALYFGERVENIIFCSLDKNYRPISHSVVSRGDSNSAGLPTAAILGYVRKNNCKRLVISHNHPEYLSTPSDGDIEFTRFVAEKIQPEGCALVDHVICGTNEATSLRETRPELFEVDIKKAGKAKRRNK